ncbi:flavodoxin family protein [Methanorbis rubei]|uniref:NADPH-dependent FMN reductase-like domain-containing protein n=1 Tax=Methanorbis rubei TaxID=3028300 RepID=A0AAE4SB82_9EURY|nr:hypothetical protein [Methanocorpusculaceae archaeon Cs1]
MNVIGIAASPRKNGNSQKLVEYILAGAEENGADTELICLSDRTIGPCLACDRCKNGSTTCVQQDGMTEIYEKIQKADAIVFGSPVYFGRLNAQSYLMLDRLYALIGTDCLSGKKISLVLTCRGSGEETILPINAYLKMIAGFFGCSDGGLVWQNQLDAITDLEKFPEKIAEAKEFGRNLSA